MRADAAHRELCSHTSTPLLVFHLDLLIQLDSYLFPHTCPVHLIFHLDPRHPLPTCIPMH